MGSGVRGFDVPFLLRRAREYSLEDRYKKAFSQRELFDVGAEYSYKIAEAVDKHGSPLVGEGVLDKNIYNQAKSFMKKSRILSQQYGVSKRDLPSELHRTGVKFSGWQLGTVHEAMGLGKFNAHEVSADVAATIKLADNIDRDLGKDFIERWAPLAFENKIISSLKSPPRDPLLATPQRFADTMSMASEMEARRPDIYAGVSTRALAEVNEYAKTVGSSMSEVYAGRGISESSPRGITSILGNRLSLGEGLASALNIAKANKGKISIGLGIAGLYALQPGSLFSGRDDEYNTIEGLTHRGLAGRTRKSTTDFGSGYKGLPQEWIDSEDETIKKFTFLARSLDEFGSKVGTAHKRIPIPKSLLSEEDIEEKLGFSPVWIAIPEAGQVSMRTYRHQDNLYHLHEYEKSWSMHRDENPAATMSLKAYEAKLKKNPKKESSFIEKIKIGLSGIPHVITEGIPGAYYYLRGQLSNSRPLIERTRESMSSDYYSMIDRLKNNNFSGKDDEYNTIEGLRHGGLAAEMRRALTDFGSGWIRKALKSNLSIKNILGRSISSEAGTGISGLTKPEFFKKGLSEFKSGGENALVSFIRSSRRIKGYKENFLVTKTYRSGGLGSTFKVHGMESGQRGIYKVARKGKEEFAEFEIGSKSFTGPAVNLSVADNGRNMMDEFIDRTPVSKYINEYMNQMTKSAKELTKGKAGFKLEAALQKQAREEMGDLVPRVLGETKYGFIQEFAGSPLPLDKRSIPAIEKMKRIWGKMLTSEGSRVRHFDPQIENIVRQGTKLRMIDFGVAARGPALSAQSKIVAEDILERYGDIVKSQLDPSIIRNRPPLATKPNANQTVPLGPPKTVPLGPPKTKKLSRTNLRTRLAKKHRESQIRASKFADKPGSRHRRFTITNIL